MSRKPSDDQDDDFGKSWDNACKDAIEGIEEAVKDFQRGMGRHDED